MVAHAIPVDPHFLYSIREQSAFTWKSIVCELIDNSFGADATEVRLNWPGGKVFEIKDNGHGTDDLARMLMLGATRDRTEDDIGYYGVGAKHALMWLWGNSLIVSSTKTASYSISVNWDDVARGIASYPDGSIVHVGPSFTVPGVSIRSQSIRSYPNFEKLFSGIANTYTPGIEAGRRILVSQPGKQPRALQPRSWPKTTKEIEDTIIAAGREVRIKMGIVADGVVNPYSEGFAFERSFRVIKQTFLGSGDFVATRIAGRVTLGSDWVLSTNKDDFFEFREELADAIYERCKDLFSEGNDQAVSFEDQEFSKRLSEIISQANRKEQRPNKGENSGTVEPKETGRKRKHAAVSIDEDGSVVSTKKGKHGFLVQPYESDSPTIGFYDDGKNCVNLNMNNEWVKDRYKARDDNALVPILYGILADEATRRDGTKMPLLRRETDEDFCYLWGANVNRAWQATVEAE